MHELVQFISRHGAALLFGVVLAEQVGIPVPAALVLLAGGAAARHGAIDLPTAVIVSVAASLIGDFAWYELGARRGRPVLAFLCKLSLEPDTCVRTTEDLYGRHGNRALLLAKFVPGLSTVAPPLAGVVGVSRWRFFLLDLAGAFLYSGAFLAAGWLFEAQLQRAAEAARQTTSSLFAALAVLAVLYIVYKYVARRRLYRTLRVARMGADELRGRILDGETPIIVDLRHESAWEQGSIPGALRLRAGDLEPALGPFNGAREIVLYCSWPNEASSARAALQLKRLGFNHVRPLEGGFERWLELGYPVEMPGSVQASGI